MKKKRIVFVCTGNTCRSAMAQFVLRHILKDNGETEITVTSCGVVPDVGSPMNTQAVEIMKAHGYKVGAHKSKKWLQSYSKDGTIIITMTEAHKKYLPCENVYSLGELTDGRDVDDPFGGSVSSYENTLAQLEVQINHFYEKVLA